MKPIKKSIGEAYIWSECRDYIEEKYNIDIRDYAGKFNRSILDTDGYYEDKPYQDFWHWICDTYNPINCSLVVMWSDDHPEGWAGEIFKLFIYEFADEDGAITFWMEW